jgi:TRAP-type C4-dicarboxylate transport system permease small subunit
MRVETKKGSRAAGWATPERDTRRRRGAGYLRRVEEGCTAILFLGMFVTIIVGVAFRLLLNAPLVWTVAVSTLAFIGVVMIGSLPLHRDDGHICFDLVYLLLPERVQLGARLASDLLVIVPFAIAIVPTAQYLAFLHDELVPGVGIPFSIAFSPFLVFLVGTVLHRTARMIRELRGLPAGRRSRP